MSRHAEKPPTTLTPKNEDTDAEETADQVPTTEAVGKAGVSLYIVIAIIVLVIALCGCFYFCKCWRNKEQPVESAADPEAGQVTHLDRNQEAAKQERMQQERTAKPDDKKKSTEAAADELAKLLPEHNERGEQKYFSSDQLEF